MFTKSITPHGWLAFELNVLRRLKFTSVILPFTNEPNLGTYLKRWNVRVLANDLMQSAWIKAVAAIENNAEKLSDEEIDTILEDVYVPRYRLQNESLKNWFNETDAWWFDNVRQNIEKISSPVAKAIALSIGMSVGDYALSFDAETLELRQPLSIVYKRLQSVQPEPVNNGQNNTCQNKIASDFIAENYMDLMFLRLAVGAQSEPAKSVGKNGLARRMAAFRRRFLERFGIFANRKTRNADRNKIAVFAVCRRHFADGFAHSEMGSRARRKRFRFDSGYCRNNRTHSPR